MFLRSTWAARARFWVARTVLDAILEGETARFSTVFGVPMRSVSPSCEVSKTVAGATFLAHRSFRATRRKRRKIDPKTRSTALRTPQAFGRLTGRVLERLRGSSGTFSDGSWTLLARPGRPKIGLGAPFGCPKAVPSATGHVSETALVAQDDPRSMFRRFRSDLAWIFVDFRPIFVDISPEKPAMKQPNLGSYCE